MGNPQLKVQRQKVEIRNVDFTKKLALAVSTQNSPYTIDLSIQPWPSVYWPNIGEQWYIVNISGSWVLSERESTQNLGFNIQGKSGFICSGALQVYPQSKYTQTLINGTIIKINGLGPADISGPGDALGQNQVLESVKITQTSNVTGIKLQPGTVQGQGLVVVNKSPTYTLTFDVQANSLVADGTLDIIQPNRAARFIWVISSDNVGPQTTALWYRE